MKLDIGSLDMARSVMRSQDAALASVPQWFPTGNDRDMDSRVSSAVTGWQSVAAPVPPQPVVWLFGFPLGRASLNRGILTFTAAPVLRMLGSVGYGERQFRRESSTIVEGGVSHRVDDETGFFGSLFAPVVLKEGDEIKLRVKLRHQSSLLDALQADGWTVQRYSATEFRRPD